MSHGSVNISTVNYDDLKQLSVVAFVQHNKSESFFGMLSFPIISLLATCYKHCTFILKVYFKDGSSLPYPLKIHLQ